jgi:hypothetical protein
MTADILFDREITDAHYISPGGYEIVDNNDNTVQFDFETYYGFIDNLNRNVLHIKVCNLDLDSFPNAINLESSVKNINKFVEFFIYTGEDCDPEINPVQIYNVRFFTELNETIDVNDKCLQGVTL